VSTIALAGTAEAEAWFEALYRASAADVHAYVASLLRDRAAAEDVVALAFERAYRRRRLFNARRGTPRAWLFGIARNAALDELRRRARTAGITQGAAIADDAQAGQDADAESVARRVAVQQALAQLAPRDRELILLKFHGQLTNAELARVLGTSETNAGTRLHRVLGRLRESFDETA
jgi:RNA polymerase sigma-70 factor (ECF subfamily)